MTPQELQKFQELQEHARNLETCSKITALLTSELELDSLLGIIMKTAQEVMKAEAASVLLLDKTGTELSFQVALSGVGDQMKTLGTVKVGEGIAGTVAKDGKPIIIENAYEHPHFNPEYDRKTGFKTGSILCAPLKVRGKIIGVCQVIHCQDSKTPFTENDLPLFRMVCDSAAAAIQNAVAVKMLVEKRQMEKDVELAQAVQNGFLPESPPISDQFAFAGKSIPARIMCGDFYDYIQVDSRTLAVVIGDVAGKGVSAAFHMARLMSDFRYAAQINPAPHKVLAAVNNLMCERSRNGVFTTAIYLLFDLRKKTVRVGNGGHPSLIIQKKGQKVFDEIKAGGVPLGIMPSVNYREEEISLGHGDRIFLYTDGIIEAKNEQNQQFGFQRVCDILSHTESGPEALVGRLENETRRFAGQAPQNDDWTVVVVQAL